jgi:hypothetical protein
MGCKGTEVIVDVAWKLFRIIHNFSYLLKHLLATEDKSASWKDVGTFFKSNFVTWQISFTIFCCCAALIIFGVLALGIDRFVDSSIFDEGNQKFGGRRK